jgi:hypothetical protein
MCWPIEFSQSRAKVEKAFGADSLEVLSLVLASLLLLIILFGRSGSRADLGLPGGVLTADADGEFSTMIEIIATAI